MRIQLEFVVPQPGWPFDDTAWVVCETIEELLTALEEYGTENLVRLVALDSADQELVRAGGDEMTEEQLEDWDRGNNIVGAPYDFDV